MKKSVVNFFEINKIGREILFIHLSLDTLDGEKSYELAGPCNVPILLHISSQHSTA